MKTATYDPKTGSFKPHISFRHGLYQMDPRMKNSPIGTQMISAITIPRLIEYYRGLHK